MFFVHSLGSNFIALKICAHDLVLRFVITGSLAESISLSLFYLRMFLLAGAQTTIRPRVSFPSEITTHTSHITYPLVRSLAHSPSFPRVIPRLCSNSISNCDLFQNARTVTAELN